MERDSEISILKSDLANKKNAVSILQAELEQVDGVARNERLEQQLVEERHQAGARIAAHILTSLKNIGLNWALFVMHDAVLAARRHECHRLQESAKARAAEEEQMSQSCKEAMSESLQLKESNQGLWRQLGLERWKFSFRILASLLTRFSLSRRATALHRWCLNSARDGASFRKLMAVKDEARRRETVLKKEVDRGLSEISRLIVVVRVMEGKLTAAHIAPPSVEELERTEYTGEVSIKEPATKAENCEAKGIKALSTVSGNTGCSVRLGSATRKIAATPSHKSVPKTPKVSAAPAAKTAPRHRSVSKRLQF